MQMITIQSPDENAIVLGLSRFMDDISDFRKFFTERLEPIMRAHFSEVFATEGEAGKAGAWQPLTDAYAKRKAKKYPGKPILVATGELKSFMTDENRFVSQASETEYTVYTPKIGIYHQRGTKDGKLPARPFFSLTEEDIKAITKNLHAFAYETWQAVNKENFRQAAISDYETGQAAKRWGA